MGDSKFININYPFMDSRKGYFVDLTETDESAVKADLLHLILTNKGERFYKPDFGTDLLKFIFEPNDSLTLSAIKEDITDTVAKFLPNLQIDQILVERIPDTRKEASVRIEYTITEDVFSTSDFVIIEI